MSQSIVTVQSFQVTIDGKAKTFATELEARQALAQEALKPRVQAYLDATVPAVDAEGKDQSKLRAGRFNVILDFLSYEAATAESAE